MECSDTQQKASVSICMDVSSAKCTVHQEIGETLVFPVRSDHVMDPGDFMFNTYRALASINRPASGLQVIVIIRDTDDIFC